MKKIIIAAIFLASANIESHYLRLSCYTILYSGTAMPTISRNLTNQNPDFLNDTYGDKDIEYCIAENLKPNEWEKAEGKKVSGKVLMVKKTDGTEVQYSPLIATVKSIVHNRFF